jgi:phenylpropionate dioxygenase-like ring-hydroxylating dioxygenase large terminal subunit
MFVRNAWYVAAWGTELDDGLVARRICDEAIVLFRTNGRAWAIEDRCCHRAAPLRLGQVIPTGVQCGYHGLVFDGSGRCVMIPGQDTIPDNVRVRSYPVVEQDQMIWIWMGEAEVADANLIPRFPYHDDAKNWPHKRKLLQVKAHYMLIVDNLMDFTHLAYVHQKNFGGDPEGHVVAPIQVVDRTLRGVRFTRWINDRPPPPTILNAVPFKGNIDRWQDVEFIAPAAIVQKSGSVDAGTGGRDADCSQGGFQARLFHGITPETENSSLYFWSIGNGHRTDDPSATETLFQEIAGAFEEDRVILEAEQASLSESGEGGLINVKSDRTRLIARHVVDLMLQAESGERKLAIA